MKLLNSNQWNGKKYVMQNKTTSKKWG